MSIPLNTKPGHGTAGLHSMSTTVHTVDQYDGGEQYRAVRADDVLVLPTAVPAKFSNVRLLNCRCDGMSVLRNPSLNLRSIHMRTMGGAHECPSLVWYRWIGRLTRSSEKLRETTLDTRPPPPPPPVGGAPFTVPVHVLKYTFRFAAASITDYSHTRL